MNVMKELYEQPVTEIVELTEGYGVMGNMDSEGETEDPMSKETTSFEEENETGIPDSYTGIWGDEEEKEN